MSSGLRLRRPVFFAAGLRCPVCLRRIALCPVFLPVFRLSLAGPHLPLPVSPSVRVSLSPHLASFVGPSSFVCIPSGFSSVISCFSVHRPSLAACCPSPVAPSIVQRLPLVVHRSLRRSSFIARRLLSVARCPSLAARCSSPVASPVPRRPPPHLFPLPFGPDHGFCIRGIPACMSAGAACRVVPQRFRRSAFPRKSLRLPQLGRRAVSDKITPCVLLSGAIFPARSAILLTIWQRLPFGTTFVQIQDVTGAPDPQGGRTPAARTENGKNINN